MFSRFYNFISDKIGSTNYTTDGSLGKDNNHHVDVDVGNSVSGSNGMSSDNGMSGDNSVSSSSRVKDGDGSNNKDASDIAGIHSSMVKGNDDLNDILYKTTDSNASHNSIPNTNTNTNDNDNNGINSA